GMAVNGLRLVDNSICTSIDSRSIIKLWHSLLNRKIVHGASERQLIISEVPIKTKAPGLWELGRLCLFVDLLLLLK
ncbi:MAG: hypothetical protein ACXVKM_12455, partial [Flavisolibacter sp.]